MINLKLEDKVYKLPESWEEVSLGQFQLISNIVFETKLQYAINIFHILTGLEEKYILTIDKNQFSKILETLNFINNQNFKEEVKKEFIIDNDKYIFKNLYDLTLGEVISIETLIEKSPNNIILVCHEILAVLYKKEGEEFDASLIESRGKLFKEKLMIDEFYKVITFFLLLEMEYLKVMKGFSENQKIKMKMMGKNKLQRLLIWITDGIGSALLKHWQRGTLLASKMFTNKTI